MHQTLVCVTTDFPGFHRWIDAPDEVAFLRNWHRHKFLVKVCVEVTDLNREIEFFILKEMVNEYLLEEFVGKHFEYSCEQIATKLLERFNARTVEVSEDGENSAIVTRRD